MNSQQKLRTKGAVFLVLLVSFGLNSCTKSKSSETGDQHGPAKVIIKMDGISENTDSLSINRVKSPTLAVNSEKVQTVTVPFNKDFTITATLVPVGSMSAENQNSHTLSTNATKPTLQTDAITQTTLADGVKYRIVVYDNMGKYVNKYDYVYSTTTPGAPFMLDAGKQYTFVAYSLNSTTATLPDVVPALSSTATLSTSTLTGVTGNDLMYFKTSLTLSGGDNNLNIVLKHLFSQITTKIRETGQAASTEALSDVTLGPTSPSAILAFSTGGLNYATASTAGTGIAFPAITNPVTTITSTPTIFISSGITNATLKIGTIKISGVTKSISIPGLSITPGVKYNLNLTINIACATNYYLLNGATATQPNPADFTMTSSTAGATSMKTVTYTDLHHGLFDIVIISINKLSDAFDMTINGTPLLSNTAGTDHLLQFDVKAGSTLTRNMKFTGATAAQYGITPIPAIATLTGPTAANRNVIQIAIYPERTGANRVLMYGAQGQGSTAAFVQLVPVTGYAFNQVSWNATGNNTIKVVQTVASGTSPSALFTAYTYGTKSSPCNP